MVVIDTMFTGRVAQLAGDSRSSAIVKTAVSGPLWLGSEGLAGDEQADRNVHGGTEKALHHYPVEHYARLAQAFPEARHLLPGGLGENLSTRGLDEALVCIGDTWRLGGALIQVSQPRSPCWKIDQRAGVEGLAAFIAEHGLTGWYYRVLRAGEVGAGDTLERVDRPPGAVSLAHYWRTVQAHPPVPPALQRMADAPGLNPDAARKLRERIARLAGYAGGMS